MRTVVIQPPSDSSTEGPTFLAGGEKPKVEAARSSLGWSDNAAGLARDHGEGLRRARVDRQRTDSGSARGNLRRRVRAPERPGCLVRKAIVVHHDELDRERSLRGEDMRRMNTGPGGSVSEVPRVRPDGHVRVY